MRIRGLEMLASLTARMQTYGPIQGLKGFINDEKGQIRINDIFILALAIVFATALVGTVASNTDAAQPSLTNFTSAQNISTLLPFLYISIPVLAIVALF